jgi:hypothetical protein
MISLGHVSVGVTIDPDTQNHILRKVSDSPSRRPHKLEELVDEPKEIDSLCMDAKESLIKRCDCELDVDMRQR